MDLGAYAQIEDLEKIMEENGISVPRLRGVRLMKNEKALTDEAIKEYSNIGLIDYERSYAMWKTFNKYCGRDDVLYIHARIGGGNWPSYREEVENQPWFIEKVDDAFDSTYCDIYARIKPVKEGAHHESELDI